MGQDRNSACGRITGEGCASLSGRGAHHKRGNDDEVDLFAKQNDAKFDIHGGRLTHDPTTTRQAVQRRNLRRVFALPESFAKPTAESPSDDGARETSAAISPSPLNPI